MIVGSVLVAREEHGMWCKRCGPDFALRLEMREQLEAKPLGSFSLAGAQIKFSAIKQDWPWVVCDNCGRESKGSVAAPVGG